MFWLMTRVGGITVMDVITAFEPKHAIIECLRNAGTCGRSDGCAARVFWESLNRTINDVVAGKNDGLPSKPGSPRKGRGSPA